MIIETINIVPCISVLIKSEETYTEKETTILNAAVHCICAFAAEKDLFLNPPENPSDEPDKLINFDLVFTKSKSEEEAENLIKKIEPRIRSLSS